MDPREPDPADESTSVPQAAPTVPLSYQAPRDRPESERPDGLGRIFAGLITGSFVVAFASFYLFIGINVVVATANARQARTDHWIAIAYFLCAAGIGAIVAKGAQSPGWRAAGRWFSLGNLLGAGVAMLIEGVCFAAQ